MAVLTGLVEVPDDDIPRVVVGIAIPASEIDRVVSAMCYLRGYIPEVHGDPEVFAKQEVSRYIIDMTQSVERSIIEQQLQASIPEPAPLGPFL